MRHERSLARNLMVSLTGALIAFWLIAIAISAYVMREEFDEVFDSALRQTTERLLAIIVTDLELHNGNGHDGDADLFGSHAREYLTYQARNRNGDIIAKSQDAPTSPFSAPLTVGYHDTDSERFYTAADADRRVYVQVADTFSNRYEAVRESLASLLIPLILLIPGSFLAIWLIVRQATRPIERLRNAIASKDRGNLAPIIDSNLPKEFEPIVRSVNHLLDRLRSALDAEESFSSNSAHELRTPIAGALAHCQILVRELPEGAARNRARTLEVALSNLANLAEKLLQLSRAASGIGTRENEIELLDILDLVVRDFTRDPREGQYITYHLAPGTTLKRAVDADAFAIVMRNIIENALIHRDPDSRVEISVDQTGVIQVVNDCPIVPEDILEALKQRFYRGDTTANGSGLGLSIAERLVVQMGGHLELHSPATGKSYGFEAKIIL